MIVDDYDTLRELFGSWLEPRWHVLKAMSVADAMAKLSQADVLLLDWDLPDGNGGDILVKADIPAVIFAGNVLAHPQSVREVMAMASRVIEKPSGPATIHKALKRALGEGNAPGR